MPRISYFHGITITMYREETHHRRPHFHARYGEYKASFDFAGEIIIGELRGGNSVSCRRGLSCTSMSCGPIGSSLSANIH
jgi:hypothetical protein